MKVEQALKKKEELENIFKNLQCLENLFRNDKELDEEISDKAETNMPIEAIIREVRMKYCCLINEWENKINNAEILDI